MFGWLCSGRCLEFFEGDNQRLSMTRLLCFLSFFPASYVVIVTKSEATLAWYLGSYVLGYVGGKGADIFMAKRADAAKEKENATA